MTKEKFETAKIIYPNGNWECWICFKPAREMEVFAEDSQAVYLICEPCRMRTAQQLTENETLL